MNNVEPISASLSVSPRRGVEQTRSLFRHASYWGWALMLLIGAWLLTMLPAGAANADPNAVSDHSFMTRVILNGAIPWLFQWLAVAIIAGTIMVRGFGLQRSMVQQAMCVTLIVGLAWWVGLAWFRLHASVAIPFADQTSYHAQRITGAQPLGRSVLYEVLGPLVNPVALAGLVTLTGGGFWQQLASTVLVIATWCAGAALLSWTPRGRQGRSRRTFALATVVSFYNAPVLLRAILRLAHSIDL